MNYRHSYHAGNFADVLKHLVSANIIEILSRKDKPICYLDTHAGRGIYSLSSSIEMTSRESGTGIEKIMETTKDIPPLVAKYQEIVKTWGYPAYYLGSSAIAKTLLRASDRLILTELHPEEHAILKAQFSKNKHIAVHHLDGYKALKAFLPPKERRGFILIDPPFEKPNEWDLLIEHLRIGIQKFGTGVYAIWYPIKAAKESQAFIHSVNSFKPNDALSIELSIYPKDVSINLIGCGMMVINPPWPLKKEIEEWLPWLWQVLSINHSGEYRIHIY